ncbi:DUF4241 domain-containing protein [Brevibacillus laterosporus]|uniref:DUF4241 domain-containing protein n=1 Tax=Brevibacillus laterosporus TaxID=1465 RepID=A0AAP3GC50_BRELA|nr:DUF4241 domain-containing protein [Brevibacillus laterosporus]MCR8978449.1 DUF4241 domain-containing protein [Brevibacillus laterosporus]MCZ0805604.1 DUF4241 domain-containing protein [Brevibacillus laterosporus]MCZ0825326.1 DUF4241 domain-containing protein [Brevibacillus laterosporus]MCZ0849102.1 DUF4241 domain-containing protein [Brevibacillus laterosporus]
MIVNLGTFQITSGTLVVSDPCYECEQGISGIVEEAAIGTWIGIIDQIDTGDWGERCAYVCAYHKSIDIEQVTNWEACDFIVGVDSGQAGIFEHQIYRVDDSVIGETKFMPEDRWYSSCCDQTLGEPKAGVINGGVVSRSGFGDGGYEAFIAKNAEGKVIAVQIVFITEEDLLEEEEDEEDEEDEV